MADREMMEGDTVIIKGRAFDVLSITSSGDVYVRDVISLELKWVDKYICGLVDPHKNPGALLDALSHLGEDSDPLALPGPEPEVRDYGGRQELHFRSRRRGSTALREGAPDTSGSGHHRPLVLGGRRPVHM